MWLAFLGASLATHYHKHINIDLLTRLAPLKAKYTMHMLAGIYLFHFYVDAFLWRFSNPHWKGMLGPLYFKKAAASANA